MDGVASAIRKIARSWRFMAAPEQIPLGSEALQPRCQNTSFIFAGTND
jgi:hypothetical protein